MMTMTVTAFRPDRPAVIPGYTFVRVEYIDTKDAHERRMRGADTITSTPGWHAVYTAAK